MKSWLTVLGLMACVSLVVFGRPNVRPSAARMGEDDFRKLFSTIYRLRQTEFPGQVLSFDVLEENLFRLLIKSA